VEAFGPCLRIDERFELEARADAVGFIHAIIVEVGELVPRPNASKNAVWEMRPRVSRPRRWPQRRAR